MPKRMTADEVELVVNEELAEWSHEGDSLVRSVTAPSFASGIGWVDAVAAVADELNHHPDIDIRYTTITFRLSTHSEGGVTHNDVELAGRIDAIVT